MPKKLDLPEAKIAMLRDEMGLTFGDIKDVLDLDCHEETVRTHYHRYQAENDNLFDKVDEATDMLEDNYNECVDFLAEKQEEAEKEIDNILDEIEEDTRTLWQKIKDFFANLF